MSVQHANRGIIKKDLQLYYNREYNGSFLGEATVNLFSIPISLLQKEGNHSTSFVTSTSIGIPDLVVAGNKQVYYTSQYYTISATGAWSSEVNRVLIYPKGGNNTALATSTSYRLSFYARSLSGNTQLGYSFYGNGINFTANLTTKWQRFDCTATTQATYTAVEFGNLNAGSMVCQIACIQVESKSYTTPFTLPIQWTQNLVNATSSIGLGKITRGATNNNDWTQSRIYSSEGYSVPCYVSFKASQTGCPIMLGLNSDPSTGTNYSYLDYAWYVTWDAGNPTYIYENGTPYGPYTAYTTSTILEIIYDGTNVNYYLDGVLIRSIARSSTSPLYLDSSFYSTNNGGAINNLSFGPLSQINRFSNYVIGGGGLRDISGNNVNANLTNVLFNGNGYYFNGTSNSIYLGTELNLQNGTISAWVNPAISSATTYHGIIGKTSGGGGGQQTWYIDWISGNALRGGMGNSAGADVVTQTWNPTIGTWYFITFVFDNSYLYLYINGVLFVAPVARTRECQNSAHPVYIGRVFEQASYAWNGQIGQVTVNRTALSAAEVLQNFTATRTTYGI